MSAPSPQGNSHGGPGENATELLRAAAVAHRFFIGGLGKQAIAEEMALSRFKVARLLDLARAAGLVHIEIRAPLGIDVGLGQRLRTAYDLEEAWVVEGAGSAADQLPERLGRAGASVAASVLEAGAPVGVAWGRTMRAMVEALSGLQPCPVVQVAGGLPSDSEDSAADMVRRLARRCGGQAHLLHAPLFVDDAAVAASLRRESAIQVTLERFAELQVVLVGVGPWDPEDSAVSGVMRPEDRDALVGDDVVAEVCGLFLRADGSLAGTDLTARTMAIRAEELRAVPHVVAVAGGHGKQEAVLALARSGLCSHLVTDRVVAEAMLRT